MRSFVFALVVAGLSSVSFSSARAASECPATGVMSDWGVNSTGYFNVASGGSCLFPLRMQGSATSSSVAKKPEHGTLKKLNVTTYEYTAKAGYKGPDSFAVSFTGKGPTGHGTSVITMNATVQ